jgi:VCBS repeat-containing protein
VSVTATDALSNVGTDGSTNELTVDTTAPIVTVTGLSTVDNTPQLSGTVDDSSAMVDVTVNGTTYAATNNGDGTWTLADNTIAPALADGIYDVSVMATDILGNVGTDASVDELTIDTTAPIVTVISLTTVDSTPQLTGMVNDPTATIDVTVNGTTYAATNNGDGTWTLADNTIAPALADGTYDVSVTATDALSNIGTDASIDELNVVSVNTDPIGTDDFYTVDEDMSFTAVLGVDDLLLNDTDVDGDMLVVNSTPLSGPSDGTLLINADGTFTYTPAADFNGTDSFRYEISDGNGGVAQATVTILINPVNDMPTASGESYSVDEDMQLSAVSGVSDLLLNDSDSDGDVLSVNATAVVGPSNGTLVLNSDGTFTYNPDADFNGTDAFTYEISDGNGAVSQAIVSIAVNPVNDAPVAVGDSMAVNQGGSMAMTEAGLLANDTDVDGDALQLVGFTQPAQGSVVQDVDGNLVYTPIPGFTGVDSFIYTVADSAGAQDTVQVMVTVDPVTVVDQQEPPADEPPPEDTRTDDSGGQESGAGADNDNVDEGATKLDAEPVTPEVIDGPGAQMPAGGGQAEPYIEFTDQADDDRSAAAKQRAGTPPPKFLYDALETIERTFDVEIADFGMLKMNHLAVWEALDSMKREMGNSDGSGQIGGSMIAQISSGTSLMLSAGILTWVLRSGALASALLSTIPVWQGFDPLPILMARKQRRDKDESLRENEKILKESKAEKLFEAVAQINSSSTAGRAKQ